MAGVVTLFLCGDVMTGRGIDQVLAHPSGARLYEPYVQSAREYVELAERANGPIPHPVDARYVWGDALEELERVDPDLRIANLETAITTSEEPWPGKGINYRMHPANVPCLAAARLDCCVLANNHVLDWGRDGLAETLAALRHAGIAASGAGEDEDRAAAPAVLVARDAGRVLVFAYGFPSGGVPAQWAAGRARSGVNMLPDASTRSLGRVARDIARHRRPADLVVCSLHWGENWGYGVSDEERRFARGLVEQAGVHVVHGHSSHHPKGIEIHGDRPILYGCGDFVNDYEGIPGHEAFRPTLCAMYFVAIERASGRLASLRVAPMRMRRFRLERAARDDARWLAATLDCESRRFGTCAALEAGTIAVAACGHKPPPA